MKGLWHCGRIATHIPLNMWALERSGFTLGTNTSTLQGVGIFGGSMRRLTLTVAVAATAFSHGVFAADLPLKAVPKVPIAVGDPWSGFYIGATAGYGSENATTDLTPNAAALGGPAIGNPIVGPLPSGPRMTGFVGGGEIGYNWRFNNMLAGLETDLSYSSLSGSSSATGIPFIGGIFHTAIDAKLRWFGTVRGRLGFLATNDFLVYGTGGLAYGDAKTTVTGTNLAGWTAGGGVEYAFMPKWTVKVEYLYLDFGKHSFVMSDAINVGAAVTASTHQTVNVVRGGVNYHF
jgi:outer membrane immunogenic protein